MFFMSEPYKFINLSSKIKTPYLLLHDCTFLFSRYIVTISPKKEKDFEALEKLNVDSTPYDPFKERKVEHPTS